ncbi:MAG TPA: alpha/beta fold hydrolase, partial [Gemmatimonadaceae bacterium]
MPPAVVPTAIERDSRTIPGGTRQLLTLVDGDEVPAILLLPASARAVPAALLLHGYTSRKERMAESLGMALLRHGVGSLSVDLPLHGEREGGLEGMSGRNPFELVQRWRLAMREVGLSLRYLAAHPGVDHERLALVGYSLGSFLAVMAAAEQPLARVVCLAAGGDLPTEMPFGALLRTVVDPTRAV